MSSCAHGEKVRKEASSLKLCFCAKTEEKTGCRQILWWWGGGGSKWIAKPRYDDANDEDNGLYILVLEGIERICMCSLQKARNTM
jgi:hypothetical protein